MTSDELVHLPATLTVEEAAGVLGVARGSAYAAAVRGSCLGRRLLVPAPRLLALLGAGRPLIEAKGR